MSFFDVVSLFGGLALFLFGMQTMAGGLEKLAGNKLESILKKLTRTPAIAVLFGALLTAAVQSSSASTVMVVGLVNSGMMQLAQAVGVIMGANIGTTITAQILALSDLTSDNFFLRILKPSTIAPVFAFIGAFLFMFSERPRRRDIGQALVGFGVLFTGMFTMEDAVRPLRESELFVQLFSTLSNPILGVLAGAIVTALIQSSSASVGILQALSTTGIISWSTAIPIILGQNIGTCITPMMASIGANKAAKRSAFCHLYFNVIGTTVFLLGIYGAKFALGGLPFWDDVIYRADIANFHTAFNIIVTLLLLPFTKLLAKLATKTVKSDPEDVMESALPILDERLLGTPSVAIQKAQDSVELMATLAQNNFNDAVSLVKSFDVDKFKSIAEVEETIDKLEVSVTGFLIKISHRELSLKESNHISMLIGSISDFERIGDHAVNVAEWAENLGKRGISSGAKAELEILREAVNENLGLAFTAFAGTDAQTALMVEPLEETVDHICEKLRNKHIKRLKNGKCSVETGLVFMEILSNLERISDHCSNLANRILYLESNDESFDYHDMKRSMKTNLIDPQKAKNLAEFETKYLSKI